MIAALGMTQPVFAAETMRPVLMRMKENKVAYVYGEAQTISPTRFVMKRKSDDKQITVTISDATKLVRRFGAKSSLAEMAETDVVEVKGTWSDSDKTQLTATFIRNNSVQARHGTFAGIVTEVTDAHVLFQSKERGIQTITPDSSTKYVNAKGVAILASQVISGHSLRVTGVWDRKLNTIKEVKIIKDQSLH